MTKIIKFNSGHILHLFTAVHCTSSGVPAVRAVCRLTREISLPAPSVMSSTIHTVHCTPYSSTEQRRNCKSSHFNVNCKKHSALKTRHCKQHFPVKTVRSRDFTVCVPKWQTHCTSLNKNSLLHNVHCKCIVHIKWQHCI